MQTCLYKKRFLNKAFKDIGREYECLRLLHNSKTKNTLEKRQKQYHQAKHDARKSIDTYENFEFLYHNLLGAFQLFDKKGELKNKDLVISDFKAGLELVSLLKITKLDQDVKSIKNCMPDLFTFYNSAKVVCDKLAQSVGVEKLIQFFWLGNTKKIGLRQKIAKEENGTKKMKNSFLI